MGVGSAGLPPAAPDTVISGSLQPGKRHAWMRIILKKGFAALCSMGTAHYGRGTWLLLAVDAVEVQNNKLKSFQGYLHSILTNVKRCIGQGCR